MPGNRLQLLHPLQWFIKVKDGQTEPMLLEDRRWVTFVDRGCFWGWGLVTGYGHEEGFWDGGHVLFLDLGAHYSVRENSQAIHFICTFFCMCVVLHKTTLQ